MTLLDELKAGMILYEPSTNPKAFLGAIIFYSDWAFYFKRGSNEIVLNNKYHLDKLQYGVNNGTVIKLFNSGVK